jgi:hypothetical protein
VQLIAAAELAERQEQETAEPERLAEKAEHDRQRAKLVRDRDKPMAKADAEFEKYDIAGPSCPGLMPSLTIWPSNGATSTPR